MAVIQISRMQVRRGQIGQDAMPQLASGELGWAIDQQQLFIGNGAVSEGAPAVGNTEILTYNRFFDLLSQSTSTPYTYGSHISASPNMSTAILRSVNDKLNDFVTSYDFNATANSTITNSLQTAINSLYLAQTGLSNNYPLRIPAGTYYVTSTVYIPANATIIGDGIDKTIIVAQTSATIFHTRGGTDLTTATISPNMGSGFSLNPPVNISISGITFSATTAVSNNLPMVVLDSAADSELTNCKFVGISTASSTYVGIDIQGVLTNNLKITKSTFQNLAAPITGNYDSQRIYIEENKFNNLYQGIAFASNIVSGNHYGPRYVNITNNDFDNIYQSAIYAGSNTSTYTVIQSSNNTFHRNVGVLNDGTPSSPVIVFNSLGNSSVDDFFERFEFAQTATGLSQKQLPLVTGDAKIDLKYSKTIQLPASTNSTGTLFNIPWTTGTNVSINYVVDRLNSTRRGTLNVMGSITGVTVTDDFTYAGSIDESDRTTALTFSAKLVDTGISGTYNSLLVQYNNPTTTGTCIATLSTIW
jgi:Pectate lyase superfamily protein